MQLATALPTADWAIFMGPGVGGAPHAGSHIPWAVLFACRRVIPVDAGDQLAIGSKVIPFAGVGAEVVHRHAANIAAHRRADRGSNAEPLPDLSSDAWEVAAGGSTLRARPQIDDVAALIGGEVFPQAAPWSVQLNHQTLARVAIDITDVELATPDAPLRKQVVEDGLKSIQQASAQGIGVGGQFVALLGRVIEVEPDDVVGHHVELQQRSCQGQNLHSTCVGVVAWRGISGTPLLIARPKLDVILSVLGSRIGLPDLDMAMPLPMPRQSTTSGQAGIADRAALERLLRYCARPPFSMERLRKEGSKLVYRCAKQRSEPRGSQYLSIRYSERLAEAGIEPSVGSKGDSYDNALAETINGLYKAEVIRRRWPWKTKQAVELATLEWVSWFNHHRLMGPLGYVPPAEFEANYHRQRAGQAATV